MYVEEEKDGKQTRFLKSIEKEHNCWVPYNGFELFGQKNNIEVVSNHSSICGGKCSITREVRREGLASILEIACSKCKKT